jgi:hypothetical protein
MKTDDPKRQKKQADYWESYIPDHLDFIGEIQADFAKPDRRYDLRLGGTYDLQRHHYQHMSALYSAGRKVDEVAVFAREAILDAYPQFVSVCRKNPTKSKAGYAGGWDDRYKYLSLAILLNLSPDKSRPLIDALDFWEEPDKGMEIMIAYLGHGEGRKPTSALLWPEAYEELYYAMSPETEDFARQGYLTRFLKGWLKEMRSSTNPAYNNHNNKHNIYFGYWCWEAAAVAVMMDIDDMSFRDHESYPKDFADWARYNKANN